MKINKNKEIIWVSAIVIVSLLAFILIYSPISPTINQVGMEDLVYGDTAITGLLIKDAPVGSDGSYYLALPDMRTILLTSTDLDAVVGKKVLASGLLSPSLDPSIPMVMIVSEIIVKE